MVGKKKNSVSKTGKITRILKGPRPPRRAKEWFSGITNKHGYWTARHKSKRDRKGNITLIAWIPGKEGKMEKVSVPVQGDHAMKGAVPVAAFYRRGFPSRLVVVTRAKAKARHATEQKVVNVSFKAHVFNPHLKNQKIGLNNRFLGAEYNYYPKHKVVIGGDFRWFPEAVEPRSLFSPDMEMSRSEIEEETRSGQTSAPAFIKRKAFGLAVNHLRELDYAAQGVTKVFAHIDPDIASVDFGKQRGYRPLEPVERDFLKEVNPEFLNSSRGRKLMVRDFPL